MLQSAFFASVSRRLALGSTQKLKYLKLLSLRSYAVQSAKKCTIYYIIAYFCDLIPLLLHFKLKFNWKNGQDHKIFNLDSNNFELS